MTIAKIAYLTSPGPNRYVIHLQAFGGELVSYEISKGHLANIIIDGAAFSLRETSINRVPETQTESATHEHHAGD